MILLLVKATPAVCDQPAGPSEGGWSLISTLSGVLITGILGLVGIWLTHRAARKSSHEEWIWNHAYDVFSNIDDTHRRMAQCRISYVKTSRAAHRTDTDKFKEYKELVHKFNNYCSRLELITNNTDILNQVATLRERNNHVRDIVVDMPKGNWQLSEEDNQKYEDATNSATEARIALVKLAQGTFMTLKLNTIRKR
ncbi:hypothetical protein [Kocuria sp. UBA1838]|uniref:hypothetical protein n=1 Tax=Kocuria sp. UBA1838 TaxID=1946673 RepID=UPI00257D8384|nr:hypothetical protein [Kocuria sp. UBA1838]